MVGQLHEYYIHVLKVLFSDIHRITLTVYTFVYTCILILRHIRCEGDLPSDGWKSDLLCDFINEHLQLQHKGLLKEVKTLR